MLFYILYIYFLPHYAVQFTLMLLPYHSAVNFILMLLSSTFFSSIYSHALSSLVIQRTSSSCCFLITQFTPISCNAPLLSPKILLTSLYSYTLSFSLNDRPSLTSLQSSKKSIFLHILICMCLDCRREDKDFERTGSKNFSYLIHY